jgi:hypothetical protein
MELIEAQNTSKSLLLASASLAGLAVSPESPERFAEMVGTAVGEKRIASARRPEAVANLLRWIAATLEVAQERKASTISESIAEAGREKVCPVYPFD